MIFYICVKKFLHINCNLNILFNKIYKDFCDRIRVLYGKMPQAVFVCLAGYIEPKAYVFDNFSFSPYIILCFFLFRTLLRKFMTVSQVMHRVNWARESGPVVELDGDVLGARIWGKFISCANYLTIGSLDKFIQELNKLVLQKNSNIPNFNTIVDVERYLEAERTLERVDGEERSVSAGGIFHPLYVQSMIEYKKLVIVL